MQTSEHAHSERVAPTGGGTLLFRVVVRSGLTGTLHARCLKADSAGGPAPCGRQKRLGPARGFGSSAFSHSLLQAERGSGASRCRSLARRVRYSRQALCNHRSSHGAAQGRQCTPHVCPFALNYDHPHLKCDLVQEGCNRRGGRNGPQPGG